MSASKQSRPTRAALTAAIERKVERMTLSDLVALASTLNVAMPATAPSGRRHRPGPRSRTAARAGRLLQGTGIGPVVSATEGRKRLDAITIDDAAADWVESALVGAGELVERLGIARGTLDNWRKAGKIIGLRKGLRNFVYPLRQFDRRGPVDGLDRVAAHFASSEEAWEWLVAPNRVTGGKAPIDALRAGDARSVVRAAAGAFDYA